MSEVRPLLVACLWGALLASNGMALAQPGELRYGTPAVERLVTNGPSEEAVDLIFVGDGFTEEELGFYQQRVRRGIEEFFDHEPFATLRPLFNVR